VTPRLPRDPDAITRAQAAAILGVGEGTVVRWRREGLLNEQRGGRRLYSRSEAEAVAANPWLTGVQAAEILGVSHVRVSQLADAGKIPVHVTRSGQRVYRKEQIEVVAHAREVRARLREGTPVDNALRSTSVVE
jgi:predicted site-specific integrase-resolvase